MQKSKKGLFPLPQVNLTLKVPSLEVHLKCTVLQLFRNTSNM